MYIGTFYIRYNSRYNTNKKNEIFLKDVLIQVLLIIEKLILIKLMLAINYHLVYYQWHIVKQQLKEVWGKIKYTNNEFCKTM